MRAPNPYMLTINHDGKTDTYDGSIARTITIRPVFTRQNFTNAQNITAVVQYRFPDYVYCEVFGDGSIQAGAYTVSGTLPSTGGFITGTFAIVTKPPVIAGACMFKVTDTKFEATIQTTISGKIYGSGIILLGQA